MPSPRFPRFCCVLSESPPPTDWGPCMGQLWLCPPRPVLGDVVAAGPRGPQKEAWDPILSTAVCSLQDGRASVAPGAATIPVTLPLVQQEAGSSGPTMEGGRPGHMRREVSEQGLWDVGKALGSVSFCSNLLLSSSLRLLGRTVLTLPLPWHPVWTKH